jgi:sodium transport system permease protein
MRWSIIRLIWLRELRDQLRDRRTVFMVVVLPLLLYPLLGFGLLQFALGFGRPQCTVGIVGADNLPPSEATAAPTPAQAASWFAAAPTTPGSGIDRVAAAAARAHLDNLIRGGYPPLLTGEGGNLRIRADYFDTPQEADGLSARLLDAPDAPAESWPEQVDRAPLESKQVDLLVAVPPDFCDRLARGERPTIHVLSRAGDDRSRLVNARVHGALTRWKQRLKEVRLLRRGLPPDYDDVFAIDNPERARPAGARVAEGLFEMMVHIFPFMLVMWSLAGALYPAVDLCAGEKERGTMETLLITPASREEIVWGKFLTIWVFSAVTTLLNLASMGLSTWQFAASGILPGDALRLGPLLWCVVLLVPTSAFFSALCLAVGAYARSSKEGQYYLMPLFFLTMPLIFLTLAPGVELNALYSMVPITGVALLLQRLMTASSAEEIPWLYFVPVMAPILFYGWLALRWAVEQFKREEVLFREAERLDIGLWLRLLFRDKEATPTTAMAFFCFALVMGLRWLLVGLSPTLSLVQVSGIGLLACMAAPPLLMALMLTRRPAESLALRKPPPQAILGAALLAVLLLLPLVEMTNYALHQFPEVEELLRQHHPFAQALTEMHAQGQGGGWGAVRVAAVYMLVFALLPAVCEELVFRGFILTGLRRRFHTGTAVVISSFLFAVAHVNVFQFLPTFVLGLVLGVLAVRGRSVLPGMAYHLMHNGLLIGLACAEQMVGVPEVLTTPLVRFVIVSLSVSLAALVIWRLVRGTPVAPKTVLVRAPLRQQAVCP